MTEGLSAQIYDDGTLVGSALLIGQLVPKIHRSDGVPVYLLAEHPEGIPVLCADGITRHFVVYPSHLPGPAGRSWSRVIFVKHERLPFVAPIPLYDVEETSAALQHD